MAKSKWTKVGALKKSKAGNLYISVDETVTLTKGASLQLRDPRKSYQAAADAGRMDADKAAEAIAKIPDFIRYDVMLVED